MDHVVSRRFAPPSVRIVSLAIAVVLAVFAGRPLLLGGSPAAHANGIVYCVGPGSGDPTSGCANPNNQDFTDINQALALAGSGDLINVASGTYPAVTISQSVTITGGYPRGTGRLWWLAKPDRLDDLRHRQPGDHGYLGSADHQLYNYINEGDGVVVTGGALNLGSDGTSTGNYTMSSGTQVNFVGGTRTLADGTTFTGAGFGRAAGASVVVNGNVNAANFEIASGPYATPALTGPGQLSVTGTLSWTGGDIGGTGSMSVASGATMTISGATSRVQRSNTINNAGTTIVTGSYGFAQSQNATFNNLAGALFDNQADAGVGLLPNESGSRTFNNAGTFRKSAGTGQTTVESTFTNAGTVDAEIGTMLFDSGFTSSSAITAASGATINWTNAANNLNDGTTISGTGTTLVSGTVTVNGTVAAATLTLPNSGTLDDEGTLNVTGTFTWIGGNLNGAGVVNILSGNTMNVTGSALRVQRANTINNSGTIVVTSSYGIGQSGGATLNNLAGGLIDLQTDGGLGIFVAESGGRTFNNAGTLDEEIGGLTAETQFDQLTVNGAASLGGTLNLSLVNNYLPDNNDSFAMLNAGSIGGTFATVNQPVGLASGQSFLTHDNPTNVTLVFQAFPPTDTPTVTPTTTASATSTATVTPTARATRTRLPSVTPSSTRTPRPTVTPRLTATPRPTVTPRSTGTRRPTLTPTQITTDLTTLDSNGTDLTTTVDSTDDEAGGGNVTPPSGVGW